MSVNIQENKDLWPHQMRAVDSVWTALRDGHKRILLTSPTGGGKSRIATELIKLWEAEGHKVVLYTNRRLLVEQLSRVLEESGIDHGVRAAGWERQLSKSVQVASLQTELSGIRRAESAMGKFELHDATRVIVDEAHLHDNDSARRILNEHIERGAAYLGLTATPIGLAGQYAVLLGAGTCSELRKCKALVPAEHYGPDEPDLRHIKRVPLGEDLSENQQRKVMMVSGIFGRVFKWWKRLNPSGAPTILFAPGVKESIWFAEQFMANGVSAAHIDGSEVWINGEVDKTSIEARRDILAGSRDGHIQVLCNRFVLREGIDCPWLQHGILATVFGSLQSYLQAGGRLLRNYPGLESVTIQDHGGNWWRHGSLNADREWKLEYTGNVYSGLREDKLRGKLEAEPCRCPQCGLVLGSGGRCRCGFTVTPNSRSRPVVQEDGSLIEMRGEIFKPRRICQKYNAAQLWERMYHRARSKKWNATFRQAEAMFAQENNWHWPSRDLPLMPIDPQDMFRKVAALPPEKLR